MNKKGAGFGTVVSIIMVVIFIVAIIGIINIFLLPYLCNLPAVTIQTGGAVSKLTTQSQGIVSSVTTTVQKKALDPAFQYLFGNTFTGSVKWLAGYKGVCESITGLEASFIIGFVALLLIIITKFPIILLMHLFKWESYWLDVFGATRNEVVRYAGILLVIYPVLTQVAIINRIIEIITLAPLTNWLIHCAILAIYVSYLPEIIMALIRYREYQKAQKIIFQTKAGEEILKAAASQK